MDTEFTDLQAPQLLSLGLVAPDGREHYGELDLSIEAGRHRVKAASDFVRHGGVLGQWGRVPGAEAALPELGRRAGLWLLAMAKEAHASRNAAATAEGQSRIEVAFDSDVDFALLEGLLRDTGMWDRVREVLLPVNVASMTASMAGELAAETCYRELGRRGMKPHHALADAAALRAAYLAVKEVSLGRI